MQGIQLKSDERGFLYLEYLGKRLMTFRGEQKLILRQRLRQAEEEIANEARSKIHMAPDQKAVSMR